MDGFLIINKPPFMTSFDVVRRVRKMFGLKKVGHAGTLDPQATGVLVLGIGKGTKGLGRFENTDKVYSAKTTLGMRTDTQDSTGRILSESDWRSVTVEAAEKAITSFIGEIDQIPPMVSAVKHKGKPLYKYARKGIEIERKSRKVRIYGIYDLRFELPDIHFKVKCSKGTYIRTLCADIGEKLGCGAVLSGLERIQAGPFFIKDAVRLEDLKAINQVLLPMDVFL